MESDVLVIFSDWRKRLFHNVDELSILTEDGCIKIKGRGQFFCAIIPKDKVNYVGPPDVWSGGEG